MRAIEDEIEKASECGGGSGSADSVAEDGHDDDDDNDDDDDAGLDEARVMEMLKGSLALMGQSDELTQIHEVDGEEYDSEDGGAEDEEEEEMPPELVQALRRCSFASLPLASP